MKHPVFQTSEFRTMSFRSFSPSDSNLITVPIFPGCDVPKDAEASRWQMVEHLRKAFRLSPSKHMELYEIASMKEEPGIDFTNILLATFSYESFH